MRKQTVNAPLLGHPFRGLAAFGGYSILATVVCVAAALPSWADTNITENVTLTEDTDWSDRGTVTIAVGVTVNLNGHNLTASDIAGSGTITDTMVDLTEPDSGGNHVWCTNTMYGTSVAANLFNNNFSRNASDDTRRLIMPTSSPRLHRKRACCIMCANEPHSHKHARFPVHAARRKNLR